MKDAYLQYFSVKSNKFNVPKALTSKSILELFFAKSWDGWAALWIINLILFLYFLNIFSNDALFRISAL